ncbi:MAG: PH domain-containing protein [Candidatus Micrarchaeota archaeon]|nr:PH domain-containing protein [Candidatus Micrarchaeota archaeon]
MALMHLDPKIKAIWLAPAFLLVLFAWTLIVCAIFFMDPDLTVFGLHVYLFAIISFFVLVVFALLPLYLYYSAEYDAFTYELTESELVIRSGLFATISTVLPYGHMTGIDTNRSILERLLGISTVSITIAGMKDALGDYTLPGIAAKYDLVSEIKSRMGAAQQSPEARVSTDSPCGGKDFASLVSELHRLNANLSSVLSLLRAPAQKK